MSRMWVAVLAACGTPASPERLVHASSIVVDGPALYVANADADSVSVIDTRSRTLVREILLADAPPAAHADGTFAPAVMPRMLALSPDGATLFATGQRASAVFAVDVASGAVRRADVCSEPVGVAVSVDGGLVYVACSQDASVVELSADLEVLRRIAVPPQPWSLGWTRDGELLVGHLLGPGISVVDASARVRTIALPDVPNPGDDPRLAHGQVRGIYDVAARPGTDEIWAPHLLLATDTPQPRLDFETTVFPAVTIATGGGYRATLSTDALDVAGIDGAFGDVVSGPHAVAFAPDGDVAYVVDTNSEDILAIDAARHVEASLLRPLPGHMPEGIAVSPDGRELYVEQRNTSDVAVVRADGAALEVVATIPRLAGADPMPAPERLGQHLFYSANSDEYPITRNHWVACASCHVEGRTDAVTWKFEQGPRDTPSNAGGTLGTGFLFRTADRRRVQDYTPTIVVEQGGAVDATADAPLLDALAAYVDHAIPLPVPPTTDAELVDRGRAIFARPDVGCATCHSGARLTDSGSGNPTLDLAGPIALHDVGTCATGDAAHAAIDGSPRVACLFDTPSLRGIAASAPYLHDGSAATLRDVLERTRGKMGNIAGLTEDDLAALVEYLRSL